MKPLFCVKKNLLSLYASLFVFSLLFAIPAGAGVDLNWVTANDTAYFPLSCIAADTSATEVTPDSAHLLVWYHGEGANDVSYVARNGGAGATGVWIDSTRQYGGTTYMFFSQISNIDSNYTSGQYTGVVKLWDAGKPTPNYFSFYKVADEADDFVNKLIGFPDTTRDVLGDSIPSLQNFDEYTGTIANTQVDADVDVNILSASTGSIDLDLDFIGDWNATQFSGQTSFWNVGKTGYALTTDYLTKADSGSTAASYLRAKYVEDKTGYALTTAYLTKSDTGSTGASYLRAKYVEDKTGFSLADPQTWSLTGNITGNLSGSVGSVTNQVTADVTSISGDAAAADAYENMVDGSVPTTNLNLKTLGIYGVTDTGVVITSGGADAIFIQGGTSGDYGMRILAGSGSGKPAIYAEGDGAASGVVFQGGATGNGLTLTGVGGAVDLDATLNLGDNTGYYDSLDFEIGYWTRLAQSPWNGTLIAAGARRIGHNNSLEGAAGAVGGAPGLTGFSSAVLTDTTTDHWKDNMLMMYNGTMEGQTARITAFTPATDSITFTALKGTPAVGDSFIIWNLLSEAGGSAVLPDSVLGMVPTLDSTLASLGYESPTLHNKVDLLPDSAENARAAWDNDIVSKANRRTGWVDTANVVNNIPGTGTGANQCTLYVYDTGNTIMIPEANVWAENSSGTDLGVSETNSNGYVVLKLNSATVYVYMQKVGYTQTTSPETLVVSAPTTDTIEVTAYNPGNPTAAGTGRLYGWIYDITGSAKSGVYVEAQIPRKFKQVVYGNQVITPFVRSDTTDANGYWAVDLYKYTGLSDTTVYYLIKAIQPISGALVGGEIWSIGYKMPDSTQHKMTFGSDWEQEQ